MQRIVVLTGAGVSKESGLDTFRDANGIWSKYNMEEVCSPLGFQKNPKKVHEFYNRLRSQLPDIKPNKAHFALAELDQAIISNKIDAELLLVTQNIDDLHEKAGSHHVIHMHGELNKVYCTACHLKIEWYSACFVDTICPQCGKPHLRPDVVWFGEMPYFMDKIQHTLKACTLFISVGTSGVVYPAAGFVNLVPQHARTVELNLEPSLRTSRFNESYFGPATQLVPKFVDEILKDQ